MAFVDRPRAGAVLRWLGVFTLAVLPAGAFASGEKPRAKNQEPATLMAKADRQMGKVRNQLRNARARLDNGVVGLSEETVSQTLGERCCGKNVQRASQALATLSRIVDGLESCYGKDAVEFSGETLEAVRSDVDRIQARLSDLLTAGNGPQAQQSMASITRAYFGLQRGLAALPDCGKPSVGDE
jgi:hypothetical protein